MHCRRGLGHVDHIVYDDDQYDFEYDLFHEFHVYDDDVYHFDDDDYDNDFDDEFDYDHNDNDEFDYDDVYNHDDHVDDYDNDDHVFYDHDDDDDLVYDDNHNHDLVYNDHDDDNHNHVFDDDDFHNDFDYDDRSVMDKQTLKEMRILDAATWADMNRIKLQQGYWSFVDRPYLIEPLQIHVRGGPRRSCYMKATQAGITESQVIATLWGLLYGRYQRGVMYLFPTTDDVREFSKARFGPLIEANHRTIGRYIQDTDTTTLKQVGDAFLYLRGGTLSKHIDMDAQESTKLRGISVDKVVFDEMDLMDMEVIGKARGRMGASDIKEEVYISNPTIPGFGIDIMFQRSDQRHWFRKCKCGAFTCAELEFPDLVGRDSEGKGYIACKKCGIPTDLRRGTWVPAEREHSNYMWGYQWSQLSSPNNDPWEILEEYQDPPDGNLNDVVRLRLGKPFINAEDKLTVQQVLACCGASPQLNSHPGPTAMGVDVRRHKNVVIGIRVGSDRYRIVRVARVQTWDEVMQMARRFHVKSAVIDIRPYEDSAREFQRSANFRCYLCEYSESMPMGTQWNENTGIVKINRTEALDASHRLIASETMLELPENCPEIKEFALECAATAKVSVTNKRTRQEVFRYKKCGTDPDDYRHALSYWFMAAQGGRIPVIGESVYARRTSHARNDYVRW